MLRMSLPVLNERVIDAWGAEYKEEDTPLSNWEEPAPSLLRNKVKAIFLF
jgi:hypothetical protein